MFFSRKTKDRGAEGEPPIVKLVNRIVEDAHARNATEVRIRTVPKKDEDDYEFVTVEYRVDGEFEERMRIPSSALPPVVNRLRVMAELRLEKHLSQHGTIEFGRFSRKGLQLTLKVEVGPSPAGERAHLFLPQVGAKP